MKRFTLVLTLVLATSLARFASGDDQLHTRARYTLRSGDSITLDYRLTPELNQTVVIQPDGFINLTMIGELRVSGMTVSEVHDLIVSKASARLNHPELNIILKEFEHPYIAVAGEVDKPGKLDFYEHTTALQAIMLAGGFKDTAQETQVLVYRRVNNDLAQVIPLNLRHMKTSRDMEHDLVLEPGDLILVQRNKLSNVARFTKATNLGMYLDPLTYVGK